MTMPKYEFSCENKECNHTSELILNVEKRDQPILCSKCGGSMLRMISRTAPPIFSGSGWTPKHHK